MPTNHVLYFNCSGAPQRKFHCPEQTGSGLLSVPGQVIEHYVSDRTKLGICTLVLTSFDKTGFPNKHIKELSPGEVT